MAAKKKTSFYHTRNKICPNVRQAAELFGVEESEILRMDLEGAPLYAERLLLMWDHSHIGTPGWEDWKFTRGALVHKNKRWLPDNLLHQWDQSERVEQLESEIQRLKTIKGLISTARKLVVEKIHNIIYRYTLRKLNYNSSTSLSRARAYRSNYWR